MTRAKIDTNSPHDGLFKKTFKVSPRASALFRAKLPVQLCAKIDWDTLERLPDSFVNPRLARFYTDLLFKARIGETELLLYVLLEHQSTVEQDMPFRMLEYMVEIWKSHRDHNPKSKRLPVIIPLLVSQPKSGWNAPVSLAEMLDPDPRDIPGVMPLVPDFALLIEDLAHLSNEQLRGLALDAVSKLAMVMLRDARHKTARVANHAVWMELCRDVLAAPDGKTVMLMFLSYLAHLFEEDEFEEFCETMLRELPQSESAVRTYAEAIHEKGLKQGLEQGREQGLEQGLEQGREQQLRVSIVDVLELRGFDVPLEQRTRIESCASLDLLQRWYAAAKVAPADQPVEAVLDAAS